MKTTVATSVAFPLWVLFSDAKNFWPKPQPSATPLTRASENEGGSNCHLCYRRSCLGCIAQKTTFGSTWTWTQKQGVGTRPPQHPPQHPPSNKGSRKRRWQQLSFMLSSLLLGSYSSENHFWPWTSSFTGKYLHLCLIYRLFDIKPTTVFLSKSFIWL